MAKPLLRHHNDCPRCPVIGAEASPEMSLLLLELWCEQHPEGHEQTRFNFQAGDQALRRCPFFDQVELGVGTLTRHSIPAIAEQPGCFVERSAR
jgi:hypothetical protein